MKQAAFMDFYDKAPATGAGFDGPVYAPAVDYERLTGQLLRVYAAIQDGQWRTLREIAEQTGDPESSVSAQLRHLRKDKFGAFTIEKQPRGDRTIGLWEYRLRSVTREAS
jgi:hypothetical protein